MTEPSIPLEEEEEDGKTPYIFVWILVLLVSLVFMVYLLTRARSSVEPCSPHDAAIRGEVFFQNFPQTHSYPTMYM